MATPSHQLPPSLSTDPPPPPASDSTARLHHTHCHRLCRQIHRRRLPLTAPARLHHTHCRRFCRRTFRHRLPPTGQHDSITPTATISVDGSTTDACLPLPSSTPSRPLPPSLSSDPPPPPSSDWSARLHHTHCHCLFPLIQRCRRRPTRQNVSITPTAAGCVDGSTAIGCSRLAETHTHKHSHIHTGQTHRRTDRETDRQSW